MEYYGKAPELKNCPFCGSDVTMLIEPINDPVNMRFGLTGRLFISCNGKECSVRMHKYYFAKGHEYEAAQQLADKWNHRVEDNNAA